RIEELDLVDADDGRLASDELGDVAARANGTRDERIAVVRADDLDAVAVVDDRLEYLDRAARDDGALHAADELLPLSAEHAPDDDLQPRVGRGICRAQLTALGGLRGRRRRFGLRVPLVEAIDAALDVEHVLLAREERVAVRADLDVELGLGRAGGERV